MKKIAVLSAGNGGQALAADLALRGHDVALYDLPQFATAIEAIRRRGNTIELQNKITGTATIRLVTTDIAEALGRRGSGLFHRAVLWAEGVLRSGRARAFGWSDYRTDARQLRYVGSQGRAARGREGRARRGNGQLALCLCRDGARRGQRARDQEGRDAGGVPGRATTPRWRPPWTGLSAPAGAGAKMCSPPACPGSIWSCTVRPCWPTPGASRARAGSLSSITRE